ncbi:MAG: rRNA maturation RNase YbeY, partial [Lachnospiraceae bacterium]|nr:rRNA maturation RNase YbeY [Lachnospiraceae bacterium]
PDEGSLLLGDIVISIPHVRAQAAQYGHSEKRELCFLVTHSLLHLIGYDHMTKKEAAVMEEKQEKILADLGIGRE